MILSVIFASLLAALEFVSEVRAADDASLMLRRHAQARIVGGDTVASDRYPYFAALQIRSSTFGGGNSISFCGGTLIADDVILTAAHCLDNPNIEAVLVTLDVNHLQTDRDIIQISAEFIEVHEDYSSNSLNTDIALLYLRSRVTDLNYVQLNFNANLPETGDKIQSVGFGSDDTLDGAVTAALQEVTTSVLSNNQCSRSFSASIDGDTMLCAAANGKGLCSGDSGGPSMILGDDASSDVQVGLTSFGGSSCETTPTVYTRLSGFGDWIKERVCDRDGAPSWCDSSSGPGPSTPNSPAPTPSPNNNNNNSSPGCFAGSGEVVVENRGVVKIRDLKIGDRVQVGTGVFEPIYSFGHLHHTKLSSFLEVETTDAKIRLTAEHLLFTADRGAIPATYLKVDDVLELEQQNRAPVTAIRTVQDQGLYAPFTPSGKIIVNGFVASSYVAIDQQDVGASERISVVGILISYHTLCHALELPHRVACHYLGTCKSETYTNEEGLSTSITGVYDMTRWFLALNWILRSIFLLFVFFVAAVFSAIEFAIVNPLSIGGAIVLLIGRGGSSNLWCWPSSHNHQHQEIQLVKL